MNFKEYAKEIEKDIIKWRRDLHQIPEIGLDLPQTSDYVQMRLKEMGIEYKTLVNGSAIVALIGEKNQGKTIALRADMDALPIKEETDVPYSSKNGNMHACGHDSHTAMLLGAAKILKDNEHLLKGTVKLLFQPGEEGFAGAKHMIEEGALENPKVDNIVGLHIGAPSKGIPDGKVIVNYGKTMTCLDKFYLKIKGIGAHGAYPELGVDPVVISAQVIGALQCIVSREKSGVEPAIITIGKINGGTAFNIIPEFIEMEGTARFADQPLREQAAKRIGEIATGIAKTMRGDCEYEYEFGYPPLVNSKEITEKFRKSAEKIVGNENIMEMDRPLMGGEDMAYFLQEVPGTFFFLASSEYDSKGNFISAHNSKFNVAEDVLYIGTALFVQTVFDFLSI
ncbi:M20 family metallopeptidase [Tissierella praeacuta]|uniref:M20 metallopeptidase family protein n=1 Tax=Tissierella praeacuta TaxID=43131 RepID=UPI003340C7A3